MMKRTTISPFVSMLLLASALCNADDAPPNPVDKPGYTLVFQEEFNGTELDFDKWLPYYLPHWTNSQNLQHSLADYVVEDGKLKLSLAQGRRPWSPHHDGGCTVSSIQSFNKPGWHRFGGTGNSDPTSHGTVEYKGRTLNLDHFNGFSHKYGYWEMRAKMYFLPDSNGHQAWWTVGVQADDTDDDGRGTNQNSEWDVFEDQFQWADQGYAGRLFNWDDRNDVAHSIVTLSQDGPYAPYSKSTEFHIYAMHWTPNGVEYYFDNHYLNSGYLAPRYPHGMLIGMYTNCWNVPERHPTVWPRTLEVDYVRVWDANEGYAEFPLDETWIRLKNRCSGNYARWELEKRDLQGRDVQTTDTIDTNCPGFECHKSQWRIVRPRNGAHVMLVNHHLNGGEHRSVQGAMQVGGGEDGNVTIYWSKLSDTKTHWKMIKVPGTDFVRFVNVSNPDVVMYEDAETNRIRYAANLQEDDVRTHWDAQTVPYRRPCRTRCI